MKENSFIKVIIADDHEMIRKSIRDSIDNKNNLLFLDDVGNGQQLVDSYFRFNPDVILVDIEMPVMGGFKAVEIIKSRDENVRALFLSLHNDESSFYQVIKAGGLGLIGKVNPTGQLVSAIWEVHKGAYYFNKVIDKKNIEEIVAKYEKHRLNDPAAKIM